MDWELKNTPWPKPKVIKCCAHLGRGEYRTIEALETIRKRLPFSLLGIDFDCGGEFVNPKKLLLEITNLGKKLLNRKMV